MKVGDMICVANYHDFCRLSKGGVMEFRLKHTFSLPKQSSTYLSDYNFITRMLYEHSY